MGSSDQNRPVQGINYLSEPGNTASGAPLSGRGLWKSASPFLPSLSETQRQGAAWVKAESSPPSPSLTWRPVPGSTNLPGHGPYIEALGTQALHLDCTEEKKFFKNVVFKILRRRAGARDLISGSQQGLWLQDRSLQRFRAQGYTVPSASQPQPHR